VPLFQDRGKVRARRLVATDGNLCPEGDRQTVNDQRLRQVEEPDGGNFALFKPGRNSDDLLDAGRHGC